MNLRRPGPDTARSASDPGAGFEALATALRARIEFDASAATTPRRFGSTALKMNGRIFAMLVKEALILKLPPHQVAALVERGEGAYFDRGQGRPMKAWIALHGAPPTHLQLAMAACAFVRGDPFRPASDDAASDPA